MTKNDRVPKLMENVTCLCTGRLNLVRWNFSKGHPIKWPIFWGKKKTAGPLAEIVSEIHMKWNPACRRDTAVLLAWRQTCISVALSGQFRINSCLW